MSILKQCKTAIRRQLSFFKRDQPALLIFLFHALFEDQQEIDKHHVDPQQRVTLDDMHEFIQYFQQAGYLFANPATLTTDLEADKNYVLITFDDGYYNNLRMLPILEQYQIHASFFVTTQNVQNQDCFWWDVVHRERTAQGIPRPAIAKEQKMLKNRHHNDICQYLREQFGDNCFKPASDTDRPMTLAELQDFARSPYVHIGNHTSEHYLLDNYPQREVQEQVSRGQTELINMQSQTPDIIAYPNGNYSQLAIDAAKDLGLKAGITLDKRKNLLPINWQNDDAFRLGRYTLWGTQDIATQCDICRSDIHL